MALKDKKTKITFHNGMRTIGGTLIEVIYEDSRIFFDFGSEYNPAAEFQPSNLQELLDEKLVPYVENIFDPSIPLKGYENKKDEFKNTAVFLSHVHLDHSKIINYLDPKIPLYTLEGTKSLLNTLNINNDFLFPFYDKRENNTRDIIGVEDNEVVEIGKIQVKVMPIDHDAYGACGLLIKTPDLVISYTGDLRFHGYRPEDTLNFCKESENADVLIIEGVSVSFNDFDDEVASEGGINTEVDLLNKINEIVNANTDKQITFNYYISNVERIYRIIQTNSRKVVLDSYYSYVLKEATGYQSYYYELDDTKYGLDENYKVNFEDLLNDEKEYFWQLETKGLAYIDKMKPNGIYIHSNAQPLGEFDPAYEPFMKNFENHKIEAIRLACSGHAHPKDLLKVINLIKPKLLVPIHSYRPEMLTNECGNRLLPEKGQTI